MGQIVLSCVGVRLEPGVVGQRKRVASPPAVLCVDHLPPIGPIPGCCLAAALVYGMTDGHIPKRRGALSARVVLSCGRLLLSRPLPLRHRVQNQGSFEASVLLRGQRRWAPRGKLSSARLPDFEAD